MKNIFFIFANIAICLIFTGCGINNVTKKSDTRVVMEAKFAQEPVKIDGKLNDKVWKSAKTYEMRLSKADKASGQKLRQPGQVKLAWDKKYFYIAAKLTDSDIVAEGKKNQMRHFKYGDLFEVFIKYSQSPYYWELYATPLGKKSTFFFPSRGYFGLPSCYEDYIFDLKVAAQCLGTVNNYRDRDTSWTAEMRMPVKELESYGDKFTPDSDLRILTSRYNYSVDLEQKELTMYPRLSKTSFHTLEEYAVLKLKK